MRTKLSSLLLLSSMLSLAVQAQKNVPPAKKPVVKAKSTSAPTTKPINKTATVTPAPTPPPPPVVLTPAEVKKSNILSVCRQLVYWPIVNYSFFLSEETSLNFGVDSFAYKISADGSLAQVKLKNDKQHTLYRFDVSYDSAAGKVREISVFSPKELDETQYNSENKKYKVALKYRFTFHYLSDSLTQILQIIPPYNKPEYSWELKRSADTLSITQYQFDNRRIFAKALLNQNNLQPDSAFYSTYSSFTPFVPELYGTNYYRFSNGQLEDFLMYGQRKASFKNYHKIYNAEGKTIQVQYTFNKMVNYTPKEHVWTEIKRNTAGLVEQKVIYSFSTAAKDSLPTHLPANLTPITETYAYNEQATVSRKFSLYEDRCVTKKVTTDYVVDGDGFVVEYNNKNEVQTRCSY